MKTPLRILAVLLFAFTGTSCIFDADPGDPGYEVLPSPLFPVKRPTSRAITGTVLDIQDNPIPGAIVTAFPGKIGTVTDSLGRFTLFVPLGKDRIKVTRPGYNPRIVNIEPRQNKEQ